PQARMGRGRRSGPGPRGRRHGLGGQPRGSSPLQPAEPQTEAAADRPAAARGRDRGRDRAAGVASRRSLPPPDLTPRPPLPSPPLPPGEGAPPPKDQISRGEVEALVRAAPRSCTGGSVSMKRRRTGAGGVA